MIRDRRLLSSSNVLNFAHKVTCKPFIIFYQYLLLLIYNLFFMGSEWNQWSGRAQEGNVSQKRWYLKKMCCPCSFWCTFSLVYRLFFFLNCDMEMHNQRISINAPMCDWLILLTSVLSEMMLHLLGNRKVWHEWGSCGHNSVTERKELPLLKTGNPGLTFLCE